MQFTISVLISLATAAAAAAPQYSQSADSYYESSQCAEGKTVTYTVTPEVVTHTVTARPNYTPIHYNGGGYGKKHSDPSYGSHDSNSNNNEINYGHGVQKPHYGAPKPDPTMSPTVVVTYTKWHGTTKAPTYETTTCTNSYTTSASSTIYYPPPAATYTVKVGGKNPYSPAPVLKYDPEVVFAHKGDTIIYDFLAANHTLTESSFDVPCSKKAGGIASGFRPNFNNTSGANQFAVTLTDDKVHWFYCGQATHCQKGMLHAINPPLKGEKTFEKFVAKAITTSNYNSTSNYNYNSTAPVPAPAGKTIKITVGGGDDPAKPLLKFMEPKSGASFIDANPGDVIDFTFLRNMHSVTESTFATPCTPKGNSSFTPTGPIKNLDNAVDAEKFVRSFTVPADNAGKPIWFYCGVADHCNKGMVFAINPAGKFDQFVKNAAKDLKNAPPVMTTMVESMTPPTMTMTPYTKSYGY